MWAGAVAHLASIAGQGPTFFSVKAGVVGLFGWFLIASFLVVGRRVEAGVGAVVAPIALCAALYSLAAPQLHAWTPNSKLGALWLVVHVFVILAAYVSLAFAFAASLLYLIQEALLKRRQLSGLWQRLPSLQVADEWIFRASAFGLALLTLGLFTGIAFNGDGAYQALRDPKVIFSGLTWAIFALYLGARWKLGWHGRRLEFVRNLWLCRDGVFVFQRAAHRFSMTPTTLKMGTRGSTLALAQARQFAGILEFFHPGLTVEETHHPHDGRQKTRLRRSRKSAAKAFFTLEIEAALLSGEIDFAVHSLKDLPPAMPDGLCLACVPLREVPADCLILNPDLPEDDGFKGETFDVAVRLESRNIKSSPPRDAASIAPPIYRLKTCAAT